MTLVARNGDRAASRGFPLDLTALASVGAAAEAHHTSRTENLVSLAGLPIEGWSFVATIGPFSITTVVVPMP
jgi:predicted YcjX-like family ATPase